MADIPHSAGLLNPLHQFVDFCKEVETTLRLLRRVQERLSNLKQAVFGKANQSWDYMTTLSYSFQK